MPAAAALRSPSIPRAREPSPVPSPRAAPARSRKGRDSPASTAPSCHPARARARWPGHSSPAASSATGGSARAAGSAPTRPTTCRSAPRFPRRSWRCRRPRGRSRARSAGSGAAAQEPRGPARSPGPRGANSDVGRGWPTRYSVESVTSSTAIGVRSQPGHTSARTRSARRNASANRTRSGSESRAAVWPSASAGIASVANNRERRTVG